MSTLEKEIQDGMKGMEVEIEGSGVLEDLGRWMGQNGYRFSTLETKVQALMLKRKHFDRDALNQLMADVTRGTSTPKRGVTPNKRPTPGDPAKTSSPYTSPNRSVVASSVVSPHPPSSLQSSPSKRSNSAATAHSRVRVVLSYTPGKSAEGELDLSVADDSAQGMENPMDISTDDFGTLEWEPVHDLSLARARYYLLTRRKLAEPMEARYAALKSALLDGWSLDASLEAAPLGSTDAATRHVRVFRVEPKLGEPLDAPMREFSVRVRAYDQRDRQAALDLRRLESPPLVFPGMVAIAEAEYRNTNVLLVHKMAWSVPFPAYSSPLVNTVQPSATLRMLVVQGPLFHSRPVLESAFRQRLQNELFNLVVVLGPLVRPKSPAVEFVAACERELRDCVEAISGRRFLYVPSVDDANIFPSFPYAVIPDPSDEDPCSFYRNPNPSVRLVADLMLGVTSYNVLTDLRAQEVSLGGSANPPTEDTESRLLSYLVGQRSFYPLWPPPLRKTPDGSYEAAVIMPPSLLPALSFPKHCTPNILILPYPTPFVRVLQNPHVLCIAPGCMDHNSWTEVTISKGQLSNPSIQTYKF